MSQTPTPWRQEGYRFRDGKKQIMLSHGVNSYHDGPEGYQGYLEMSDEDAAFALGAVNSRADLIAALQECEEYFDNRADADCDQDGYIPNEEMKLLQVVREALGKAGAL